MIKESKYIVVLSGAGISTSAGIPDFRGPKGIWTVEENDKKELKRKRRKTINKNQTIEIVKCEDEEEKKSPLSQATIRLQSSSSREQENDQFRNSRKRSIDKKLQTEERISSNELSFEKARPTETHNAISKLVDLGIIKYVITQNVDGLHRRSGVPRSKQSILHGCIFTEKCRICSTEYFRNFDVGGVSFQPTGRKCTADGCAGDLLDTILDWEDELPDMDWGLAQEHCARSDLVLAIGTSLRIEPAGSLPTFAKKFVIINKQVTPYDDKAALIIRAPVDDIFSRVMNEVLKE